MQTRKRKNVSASSERDQLFKYLPIECLIDIVYSYQYPRCCLHYESNLFVYCQNVNELNKHQTEKRGGPDVLNMCAMNQELTYFLENGQIHTSNKDLELHWNCRPGFLHLQSLKCFAPMFTERMLVRTTVMQRSDSQEQQFEWYSHPKFRLTQSLDDNQWNHVVMHTSTLTHILRLQQRRICPMDISYCRAEKGDLELYHLEVRSALHSTKWYGESVVRCKTPPIGFCASAKWVVLVHAAYLNVYHRKQKIWTMLCFPEMHCVCFSLEHPVMYDNLVVFVPQKRVESGLDTMRYDLCTMQHIPQTHTHCAHFHDGPRLRNAVLY